MRSLAAGLLVGLICLAPGAVSAEATTTRIETRPFYGATVTLEEGVRVFRPLPRHDRVIINPNGQTPLYLGISETTHHSFNHHHHIGPGAFARPSRPAYYGGLGNVLPRAHRHRQRADSKAR